MDVLMEPKSFNSYRKIYTGEKLCKLSADTVIPDTFEDISRLLSTGFKSKIISKDVNYGKITVNGEIEAVSLFIPENDNSPQSVFISIPFTAEFSSDDLDSSNAAVSSINIVAADWRELNPRKIGVNLDVLVEVKAFSRTEISLPCVQPEVCENACFKSATKNISNISLVSEKLASIEDEHEISDAEVILASNTDCFYDSSELIGNRLIVKGHTHSRIIYRRQNGDISSLEYDTPFSQLFDHDENADITDSDCVILPAGEYYEINGDLISMELRMVLQLVCYENREITYVADAYYCGCEYELNTEEMSITAHRETVIKTQNIQISCELPEKANSVYVSGACTGKLTMSGNTVNVPVVINAIGNDGDMAAFSFRVRGSAEFEEIFCENLGACIDSVNCAITGSDARFDVAVKLKGSCRTGDSIKAVSSINVNTEVTKNISPSVIIARAESGDIWDIAKKYGADQNRISEINGLQDDDDITGRMLLIPKS